MAIHVNNTPSGVNEPALPALRLLPGAIADRRPGLLPVPHELLPEPLIAQARARHARRALEDAAHHGAALLAALGLPLVSGPGAAIADAIDLLDDLDRPHQDLEDDELGDEDDPFEDGADSEPSLARPEGSQWEVGEDLDHELPTGSIAALSVARVIADSGRSAPS